MAVMPGLGSPALRNDCMDHNFFAPLLSTCS
jgi:hypothetical protein